MSDQQNARAEAEKLLRQASASAKTAKKAQQAEQLFAEIGKIQSASKDQKTEPEDASSKKSDAQRLAERIMRLEGEQSKARAHIEQLVNAKRKLEKARQEALATESRQQQEYNRKLQAELAKAIAEKEKEYRLLVDEIAQVKAMTDAQSEQLRAERDKARDIAGQKKAEEDEQSGPIAAHSSRLPVILFLIALLLLGGGAVYTFFPQWFEPQPEPIAEAASAPEASQPKPPPKPKPQKPTAKAIREFSDPLRVGGTGPVMVELSGGTFKMGVKPSMPFSGELPQLEITLQPFSISKHEITFEEFDRFSTATKRPLLPDNGWGRDRRPVVNVTWDEAKAYTNWLSAQTGKAYRLPYEREWEFAAKANTDDFYWWGSKLGTNHTNCGNCGSRWDMRETAPVGSFKPNGFGLHDTIGNVLEWTQNCRHLNYAGAPLQGNHRDGGDCGRRMVRGGSFQTYGKNLRVTRRIAYNPKARNNDLGFRVVRSY